MDTREEGEHIYDRVVLEQRDGYQFFKLDISFYNWKEEGTFHFTYKFNKYVCELVYDTFTRVHERYEEMIRAVCYATKQENPPPLHNSQMLMSPYTKELKNYPKDSILEIVSGRSHGAYEYYVIHSLQNLKLDNT